jgi:hypothetical protein
MTQTTGPAITQARTEPGAKWLRRPDGELTEQ